MEQNPGHNLVALFNRGNEKAFYGLFNELYPSVFTLANKMVRNTQEAQDICTESFIKLFRTEEKFESIQNLKAFLFTITRHACLDALKKEERHSIRHKELLYLMEYKEDIFKQEVEAELVELIYASIERLPTKCRKIFKMILAGFSVEEIAAKMNISVSTVWNQKSRGVKLLRIALLKEKQFSNTAFIISILLTLLLNNNRS
jgi:RNA polymerase sigma-70 factor (ECF subfamily)